MTKPFLNYCLKSDYVTQYYTLLNKSPLHKHFPTNHTNKLFISFNFHILNPNCSTLHTETTIAAAAARAAATNDSKTNINLSHTGL